MLLFCPSYQIPGTWAENCEYLAERQEFAAVQGVELLFFRFNREDRELFVPELPRLRALRDRFAFSLHLPDPLLPSHAELLELTSGLVEGAVMHLPQECEERSQALLLYRELSGSFGIPILMENTAASVWQELPEDSGLCLDTGHALLAGENPSDCFRARRAEIEALHLHDVFSGRDHAPLSGTSVWLREFLDETGTFAGRCVVEVFDEGSLTASIRALELLTREGAA